MPDAGEIKAKVTIEYDGSGVEKAKEDLATLAEAAGSAGESMGKAGTSVSELFDQFKQGTIGVQGFSEGLKAIESPASRGVEAIGQWSEALGGSRSAVEETGKAFEQLAPPLESTVSMLGEASAPMAAISEHAQSMAEQLGPVSSGFTQIQESLTQSVPLLPQYAESMQSVNKTIGSSQLTENMAAFQDAMVNPYPFSMIQSHLDETGQTWSDFTSSIGSDNTKMLHEMATTSDTTHQVLGGMSTDFQSMGKSADAGFTAFDPGVWTDNMHAAGLETMNLNAAVEGTGKTLAETGGAMKSAGIGGFLADAGGAFGGVFGGVMNAMNQIAMPLMAVQMIGMAVSTVATGMYNAAAIAEGPAAHGVGTFTGSVDALNQTMAKSGQTFSETFGQQMIPTITALNDTTSKGGGFSGLGGILGGAGSFLANLAQVGVGGPFLQSGLEGFANQGAQLLGQPLPYPGPAATNTQQAAIQQQIALIPQQIALSTATMQAQASSPAYLAAQASLSSAQQQAVVAQGEWKDSHIGGSTGPLDPLNNIIQAEMVRYAGGSYGGTPDPNAAFFNSFAPRGYNSQQGLVDTGGCFPAGTFVRLANGGERAIEALQPGDQVIAHDGIKQVPTVVLARIVPPPKQTYQLTFVDGNTLTLTDSHPIASLQGWKSLSPAATKEENPDLDVAELQVGDHIYTSDDVTCTLITIEKRDIVQVYNITVDEPHTFYANGILVHNKFQSVGAQIMQNVADAVIPSTDLRGSNLMSSITANFTATDLSHTFTASVNWIGENLDKSFTAVASWAGEHLSNVFTGVATWFGTGLNNTFIGIASWAASGLEQAFTAVANWTSQNLSQVFTAAATWFGTGLNNTFIGIASWAASGLEHAFTGIVTWIGENLEHTFVGIANWIGTGLQQTFYAAASIIPGFASGVQNYSGGMAVVGESGPELVTLPGGSSVYPMNSSSAGMDMSSLLGGGNQGNSAPQSINLTVHLDSQPFIQAMGIPLAQNIRVGMGQRGY